MGNCCTTSRYSVGSIHGNEHIKTSGEQNPEQAPSYEFNIEVVQPTQHNSKVMRLQSFASHNPQGLFKPTDVQACFKYTARSRNKDQKQNAVSTHQTQTTLHQSGDSNEQNPKQILTN